MGHHSPFWVVTFIIKIQSTQRQFRKSAPDSKVIHCARGSGTNEDSMSSGKTAGAGTPLSRRRLGVPKAESIHNIYGGQFLDVDDIELPSPLRTGELGKNIELHHRWAT